MPERPSGPRLPLEPVLSPSRAADFMQCPLLFRFRTVDRLPEEPKPAAVRGTLVHAVLDDVFSLAPEERTPDSALAMVEPRWDVMVGESPEFEDMFDSLEDLDAWLEDARTLVRRYFEMEHPGRVEPRERELRLDVTLESGLRLRGYVDRLDVAPNGAMRVVDYKTGKAPPPRFTDKARFQIYFYALMIWRVYGEIPRRLQLMYLGDSGWLWYEPTEGELRAAEVEIQGIWEAIEATARSGEWPAKPSKLCGWCDHQAHCPEFGGTPPPLPTPEATPN
ncbi:PD-(D/E)XK nuclease family protein [Spiractinospora alimapuensis]|uniref:RecB family exonuclease n=1 Tax=Spiractinospora alimapuensis TaxID=2820884 RepID=UPI001F1DFEC8|nr:PD-(D/E)XK nuclease family protein [Spiractinospora alimapuensis]QVQ52512.1 PD-(D/E)XK nuclease family protein [Spiractinospora alimapuensis]